MKLVYAFLVLGMALAVNAWNPVNFPPKCFKQDIKCVEHWECCSSLCYSGACLGHWEDKCVKKSGYCLQNSDCCSGSCLSYTHVCVGQDMNKPYRPPIFVPWNPKDAAEWEAIIKNAN